MCTGREGTAGKVKVSGSQGLLGRDKPGAEGQEEMIIVASGYIFRKGDALWFPHEDVGKETQSS